MNSIAPAPEPYKGNIINYGSMAEYLLLVFKPLNLCNCVSSVQVMTIVVKEGLITYLTCHTEGHNRVHEHYMPVEISQVSKEKLFLDNSDTLQCLRPEGI